MRRPRGILLAVTLGSWLCLRAAGAGWAAGEGVPPSFEAPFSADSCWKTALPAGTEYVDVGQEWKKLAVASPGLAVRKWTVGVYRAQETDPVVKVLVKGADLWRAVQRGEVKNSGNPPEVEARLREGAQPALTLALPYYVTPPTRPCPALSSAFRPTIHCPRGALPSPDSDGHLAVLQPDGHTLFEAYCAVVLGNGDVVCSLASFPDLAGYGDGGAGGLRASLLPCVGGLLRAGELERGEIGHALACLLYRGCLQWGAHVWPAVSHDTNSGYSGTIPMGARLAIPATVDLAPAGLSGKGLVLARALQQYGMYVVDRGGRGLTICAELGYEAANPETGYPEWWGQDGPRLLALLKMVRPPAAGDRAVQFAPDGTEVSEAGVQPPEQPTLRVGPGQPYADIAAALAALPAAGGTVRVAPGRYLISASLRLPSHTALLGDGEGVEIALAPNVVAHLITNADHEQGNEEIVIRHLTLTGNLNSQGKPPGPDNHMRGQDGARGVYFVRVHDALVEDCTITETASNSFRADECARIRCARNTIRYCWHCCNCTHSTNCLIVHNHYERQWSGDGVYFNNTTWSLIADNQVRGVGAPGITLEFNSCHNIVSDNLAEECLFQGIAVLPGCNDNRILRNTCRGNGRYRAAGRPDGIYLQGACGNLVADNRCFDTPGQATQRYGVNLSGPDCRDNTLCGNSGEGNALGALRDAGTDTNLLPGP